VTRIWPDVFMEIVRPLIRNMRDVRRYAAAIRGTVCALGGQVALADVLSLEAVRVFLPDVFRNLHSSVEALTTTTSSTIGGREFPPRLQGQIEALLAAAGSDGHIVRAMIGRLFPAGQRHVGGSHFGEEWKREWLKEHRVAHEDILRLYLERLEGAGFLAFTAAERALTLMADRHALDRYLRSLKASTLQDVISSLEAFQDEFKAVQVVPGTIVLLNLLPDIPERKRSMFELDVTLVVSRVTLRLLWSLKDAAATEAAVRQIMPELNSLSSKLELIEDVGHRKDIGHKLVSEEAVAEFEKAWRAEVRTASVETLSNERRLIRVLLVAKRQADTSEGQLAIADSPTLTLALLRSARSEIVSKGMGSRSIHRTPQLAWDSLIDLYGNEATLSQRIADLKAASQGEGDEVLDLAEKYVSGWRPDKALRNHR